MKNRTLPGLMLSILLGVMLAVPVFAQDNSSSQTATTPNSASQSSSSSMSQSQPAANQNATGKEPLQPASREGFWGRVNPFARKKYVARQTEPIRDRVNELDELTAANSKQIKDVDSRAQQGIQMASAKANEADLHAIDAGNKAQAAQHTADQASTRLNTVEQVVTNIDQYQPATQTEILFKSGPKRAEQECQGCPG